MKKLQLYIYKSLRGFKSLQNINPSDNVQRHIRDVRNALELIDYDPAEKYVFYLLSYIEEGSFLTILRTIPTKPLDHLASTIFIPNGMKISREDLSNIVNRTSRMLSNPSMSTEQMTELHELFSKEYPEAAEAPAMMASAGREYAFSFYGGDSGREFGDIFGDLLYQTSYLKFAGVLMVDAELGVSVDATDVTDAPVYQPATLLPPEPSNGFQPFLFGHKFDRPFRVSLGTEAAVVWKRRGFDDIIQSVEVSQPVQSVEPEDFNDSRKTITRSTFYVSANGGKTPIENAEIIVNGVAIEGEHQFSLDELTAAKVSVHAPGFRPYQATLNLAATTQALITLNEQKRIYGFELPVKSTELGSPIRFEIHTKRQLTDSPVEGYSLVDEMREGTGRFNHLHYTGVGGLPIRQVAIYCGCALLAGFLLGWLIMGGGKATDETAPETPPAIEVTVAEPAQPKTKPEPAKPAEPAPAAEPAKPDEKKDDAKAKEAEKPASPQAEVTAASITYLDANSKWTRDELEKQPGLAGLFDDLNNFRLERINSYWGPKLKSSKRFAKVAFHAGEGQRKKIFKPEGTYCKDGDKTITVQSYLNKIDPAAKTR